MNNKKNTNYNNGIIDGIRICEEEERKLIHGNNPKKNSGIQNIFNFQNLN